MQRDVLITTDFKDLKQYKRGKVRDVYDLGDKLLIVATDRISCFDVVLPSAIPHKGEVLTQISLFWFKFTEKIMPNHLIAADINEFPQELSGYRDVLAGRSMLVKKSKPLPIECVVRGYLSGSGWKEYQQRSSICGVKLVSGFRQSDKLPNPIFTPSTKEDVGHDVNVDQNYVNKVLGVNVANKIKEVSIQIYKAASGYAMSKGIIIADTKFEFGMLGDKIILIDEVLTPDSSRFWPRDEYKPGRAQASLDKQFVRDYLETLDWDKVPPGPELPPEIIKKTSDKYLEIFKRITGTRLL